MIVAAIDPSLTNTAVCSGSTLEGFEMRCFSSKPVGKGAADRVKRYERHVGNINKHLEQVKPNLILIEDYVRNSNSILGSAEFGGILRWHLVDHTPLVFDISPMTLKKFVTGSGKGKKEMMIAHVVKKYGHIFNTNDEVDAFGMYHLALCCAGLVEPTNQPQRDAMNTASKGVNIPRELNSLFNTKAAF